MKILRHNRKTAGRVVLPLLAVCFGIGLGACVSASHTTEFDAYAKRYKLALPTTVDYSEFVEVANVFGVVDIEEMLASMEITVVGSGDGRYLRRADLLRACGKECRPDDGLGQLLVKMLVYVHGR